MNPQFTLVAQASAVGIGRAASAAAEARVSLLLPSSGTCAALGNEITDGLNLAIQTAGRSDDFGITGEAAMRDVRRQSPMRSSRSELVERWHHHSCVFCAWEIPAHR